MRSTSLVLAALLALLPGTTVADGDHKPKHGGVIVEAREVQYELVLKPDAVALYVEDHGKPVDTRGATARLTLLAGKDKTEATLTPAGGNKLEAKGSFAAAKGTRAVAVVTLAGKPPVTARFSLP